MAIDWGMISQAQQPIARVVAGGGEAKSEVAKSSERSFSLGDIGKEYLDAQKTKISNEQQSFLLKQAQDKAASNAQTSSDYATAAAKGEQALFDAHDKAGDPMYKYNVMKKKADIQNVISESAQHQAAADKSTSDVKTNNNKVIQSTSLAFGSIADKAFQAEKDATQAALKQAAPGGTQIPMRQGQVSPDTQAKAQQAGQMAGQQVYGLLTSQLDPATQQSLKDKGLDQWNLATNHALHSQALDTVVAQKQAQEAKDEKDYSPAVKTALAQGKLQTKVDNGTATTDEKNALNMLNSKSKLNQDTKESAFTKEIWGAAGQKYYTTMRQNTATYDTVKEQADVASSLLNQAKKEGLVYGPGAGKLTGTMTQNGQELGKVLASMIPLTVKVLGIPATALRSASMIGIVQKMNPTDQQYIKSQEWILNYMNYLSATAEQREWKEQSDMVHMHEKDSPDEVKSWDKKNPNPMTQVKQPNFAELYKINPQFQQLGIEKDLDTAQQAAQNKVDQARSDSGQDQSSQNQPGKVMANQVNDLKNGETATAPNGDKVVYNNGTWSKQ